MYSSSHTDRPIEEWTKVLLMDDEDGDMHFRNLGCVDGSDLTGAIGADTP